MLLPLSRLPRSAAPWENRRALAEVEGDELSTISQRLRVLRAENVAVRRRRGKHINYALAHTTESAEASSDEM
jgi:hypothetical protein